MRYLSALTIALCATGLLLAHVTRPVPRVAAWTDDFFLGGRAVCFDGVKLAPCEWMPLGRGQ